MDRTTLVANVNRPISRFELISRYCRDKDVLDIGCVNHNIENTEKDNWLHQKIREVAAFCMGLDLLDEEVRELQTKGYHVICADITHPVDIEERFDVIVLGNLIEHLSNFDGLFMNIDRLLKSDGFVLISTANPFFSEQYFYSAFKNDIIINPEHTCWMDPVALDQLIRRYGFFTHSINWIKEKWSLSEVVCNGGRQHFDILTGGWTFHSRPRAIERRLHSLLMAGLRVFFPDKYNHLLGQYGSHPGIEELLYIKFKGFLFHCFWRLYSLFIVKSPLNRYEMYMSVIKRDGARRVKIQ